jgi:hypothetical protein
VLATETTDAVSEANPVVSAEYPRTYCMYRVADEDEDEEAGAEQETDRA